MQKTRDEAGPAKLDANKALWNWRRRGFSDAEIAETVRQEEKRTFARHPVTNAGCAAILEALGAR